MASLEIIASMIIIITMDIITIRTIGMPIMALHIIKA